MSEHEEAGKINKDIPSLYCRKAMPEYGISNRALARIRKGGQWSPKNGNGHSQETVQAILASVKEKPHLNTAVRAKELGFRVERVQAVLKSQGISKLNPDFGGTPLCRL